MMDLPKIHYLFSIIPVKIPQTLFWKRYDWDGGTFLSLPRLAAMIVLIGADEWGTRLWGFTALVEANIQQRIMSQGRITISVYFWCSLCSNIILPPHILTDTEKFMTWGKFYLNGTIHSTGALRTQTKYKKKNLNYNNKIYINKELMNIYNIY